MTDYSWGEFYETTIACEGYTEEQRKRFIVFEALDKAISLDEVRRIINPLTENEINWLNSPCLDGIISIISDHFCLLAINIAKSCYIETCKYYLSKNLVKFEPSDIGCMKCLEMAKMVLSKYEGTYTKKDYSHSLVTASMYGHDELVLYLLKYDIDIQIYDNRPLYLACVNSNTSTAEILLKNGAVVSDKIWCHTIYTYEHRNKGNIKLIRLLLENGADIHHNNEFALRAACHRGYDIELIKLLLSNGSIIIAACLYNARVFGHKEILEILENH